MTKQEIFTVLGEEFTREEAKRQIEIELAELRRIGNSGGKVGRHVDIIAQGISERVKLLRMLVN